MFTQKKIRNIAMYMLLLVLGLGCQKEKQYQGIYVMDGSRGISQLLNPVTTADFTVTIGTYVHNLLTSGDSAAPQTAVTGYHSLQTPPGSLSVNNLAIEYSGNQYERYTDSLTPSSLFAGHDGAVTFVSADTTLLPSFQRSVYAPASTPLTFVGPVAGKLSKALNLTVNWAPDDGYLAANPGDTAYLAIQGRNNGGQPSETMIIGVADQAGTVSLTVAELSRFHSYTFITVTYGRGCRSLQNISGKTVLLQSRNLTAATIVFE